MTTVAHTSGNFDPKFASLLLCTTISLYAFVPFEHPSLTEVVLKCLPIITLMIFVALHIRRLPAQKRDFPIKIFCGLLSGCIGDYFLIWPNHFEIGVVAFAIGHIFYIRAFGFEPLNLPLGIAMYTFCITTVILLDFKLSGILAVGIPLYSLIIGTMAWRAFARLKKTSTYPAIYCAMGALSFVFSDLFLSINKFKYPLPYEAFLIMSTYYGAQIGIGLSIFDPELY